MPVRWNVTAVLAFSTTAAAADLTVYLQRDGAMTLYQIEAIAGPLLQKAGVTITWRSGPPPAAPVGNWLRIDFADRTPTGLFPGALAVAHPYAGCSKGITVFVDRVRAMARRPDREPALFAYVLAHEIAHVLQGVDRHSDAGVMKAHWSASDCEEIYARRLDFLEEDVIMIHQGFAKVRCHPPEMLRSASESGISVHPD
jgi:hypothetical protein